MIAARLCVPTVAMAAPMTPDAGIGPQPKMKIGSSAALRITVPSTMNTGSLASPTPRITDWNMKKKKLNTRPTNDTRMKPSAPRYTSGAAPMRRSMPGAMKKPHAPSTTDTSTIMSSVCAATWSTMCWFFAPKYCAMSVDPAIARPAPNAMVRNITGVESDTAATAAPPMRPTQKASMSW